MDNFEYSIQLNDREWAEFFLASEECNLAPASLATAEEPCLSDIEQGDGHAGTDGLVATRVGSEPVPGTGSSAPRGVPRDIPLLWPAGGHLSLPELLSGSEDEAELGSVSRFLCDSDEPGWSSPSAMPSAQRRQPPRPPTTTLASPAGGTAQGNPGQDTAGEATAPAPASEKGAAGGSQAMEPGTSIPEQGRDSGEGQAHGSTRVAQPGAPVQGSSPAPSATLDSSAGKSSTSASHSEPRLQGPPCDPPSPSLGTAQEEPSGERMGTEPSSSAGSPNVVRPKVPGQQKKSRKQRGAEAAQGDREPGGAAAPGKAPLSSPMSSRKSKGKEKAGKAALVRLGSEEAAEAKRQVPGPGGDEGDPAGTAALKQKMKEPGAQSPGKTKATKHSKAGQAGGLGVRDSVPVILDKGAVAPSGEACQEMPGKPPQPKSMAAFGGNASAEIPWEPASEVPRKLSPPCFADGASAMSNTLDVTWPEIYDYLFCDSQEEEEEEVFKSVEGQRTPLEREISWPELYEYFFNEPEGKRKKVKGEDRKRKKFSNLDHTQLQNEDPSSAPVKDTVIISVPEVYERIFSERPRNRMGWRGIFSITPASELKKAVGALKSLLQRQMHHVRGQASSSQALVRRGSGEKLALVPLAPLGRGQVWPEGEDMALALRGTAEDPRVLTHKDMCLVFCAFASWAVKTSDLQAPDAWKTMFLASFGTLSAIRYFRRQVREGHPRT
ncbi:PERM1 protein, partial [Serilophus lunatus]|nr:PERM1 protein [Serilophus lunatus]